MWFRILALTVVLRSHASARAVLSPSARIFRSLQVPNRHTFDIQRHEGTASLTNKDTGTNIPTEGMQEEFIPFLRERDPERIEESVTQTTMLEDITDPKIQNINTKNGISPAGIHITSAAKMTIGNENTLGTKKTTSKKIPPTAGMSVLATNVLLKKLMPPAHQDKVTIDVSAKMTTIDPWEEFCKEACAAGMAGDECDCAGHPIG